MEWLNEPAQWSDDAGVIRFTTGPQTDFWRKTHDGGIRDTGHCYGRYVDGDFVAEVTVRGEYAALYDQAGLMVRQDETVWMKCGIELFDGMQHASAVVTRDFSDWSVAPLPSNPPAIRLRVTRKGSTIAVYYALSDAEFQLLRQATIGDALSLFVGVMAAAPTGEGLTVSFEGFEVT